MKYALDKMLPLKAFQRRGTPIGGRGLRVYGDGGYTSGDYDPNWLANTFPEYAAANPEPAPSYQEPAAPSAPEASIIEYPGFVVDSDYSGGPPPTPALANQWQQTVNDIYQQEFGRQADASGMESFTNLLNQGLTGEQMREALRTSAEGQSYGLSPVAPTAPAAPVGQFEYQPSGYAEFGGEYAPYFLNTTTGERREVNLIDAPSKNFVDVNNLAYHLAPNFEGTPTQFYDADGNLKAALIDMVPYSGSGEYAIDPMSLGLALDKGEKVSINSAIQARDEQNRLLFIDPYTGETTPYNTGVPAKTGQTVKDRMYINDPMYNKRGLIPADMTQGLIMMAAAMATGGVGGALLDAAGFGAAAGSGAGLGAGAVAGGDIGAFLAADAAASAGSAGINYGAALTTAAKSAAINAAVTAAQGGKPADILRAAGTGAISGGVGALGADYFGAGTIGQIGTQTATAAAIAAASGRDPMQAALNGALSATLANIIPSATSSVLGSLPESVQRAANTAISSSVIAAIQGGNVGTAALMGVANSAISSVAGAIGDTQVVKDLRAAVSSQIDQIVNDFKFNTGVTNVQALPIEGSNRSSAGEVLDTAPYDANAELDKIIQNLPSYGSASGVEYTPAPQPSAPQPSAPLSYSPQQLDEFFANYQPSNSAPLTSAASATTSDANPPTLPSADDYIYYRDDQGNQVYGPRSMAPSNEITNTTNAGSFLGAFEDLAPAQSKLATFGQGMASALDNTVGAILPTVAQMASYLGLRTADQIAELTASLIGKEYQSDPAAMREISNRVAEAISNPVGKAFGVTNTSGYTNEASGRFLRFISENMDKGADYLSEKTGLPAGDIRLMTDAILMRPGTALSTIREAGTAVKDVGRGYADAATGVVSESPTGAYDVGARVADLTRASDTSLYRDGTSNRPINLESIIDMQEPISGSLAYTDTPKLGYTPQAPIARAPLTPERMTSLEQMFNDMDSRPTYDVPDRAVRTQLVPESRGALPTTLAEPALQFNDFGANIDSSSLATITEQSKIVDSNLGSRTEPQRQAQSTLINESVKTYAPEGADPSVINFWNKTFAEGALSKDVIDGIKDTFDNKAAPPEVILKQVDEAISQLKNLDEQLPAKLEMLSNAEKLGITPAEAIELGLLNKNGTKTELGEMVQPQPKPQPKPDPVLPVRPVKPVFPIKPVLPPPPIVYPPPPIVNPPPPPIVNPPIDVNPPSVNPPINIDPPSIIPPSVNPPLAPSKLAAPKLAAPAASLTPSYMYGVGTQGTTIGALPGNLEGTFLQGANVNEYNPFENYNVYQQLAPIRAAEGGSPLQLAQMQQGITGIDPRLYSALTRRQAPNYFTYGQDTSGGNPTTFAGSQLMGKPSPRIPVIPTGKDSQSDYLYQGSGTNPLARAGAGIASLPSSMMAAGGQAHGGEHIPEFITGATGHYVKGRGTGQSDQIPAMLADGEWVADAATVADLGDGSSDAGARLLDEFRKVIREHKRSAPKDKIPPKASPLEYMKEALQQVGRK